MKTPSDDLFNLIKSLTAGEKRHFKLSANTSHDKSYMRLFDLIDRQKLYNEANLIEKLKNDPIVNNFKKWKTYISEVVLKSLESYHHTEATESIIEREIHRARILLEKGLNSQAFKHLLKAQKMAISSENYEYLPSINKLLFTDVLANPSHSKIETYFKLVPDVILENMDTLKKEMKLRKLFFEVINYIIPGSEKKNKKNKTKNKKLIHHPLLKSISENDTFIKKHLYHLTRSAYLLTITSRSKQDYIRQKKWINYIESNKSKIAERGPIYLSAINNFLITLSTNRKAEETEVYFSKAVNFTNSLPEKFRKKIQLQKIYSTIINNYIREQVEQSRPDKAIEAWNYMQNADLTSARGHYANTILYFNLFYAYFLSGEYRKAIEFGNKIINDKTFLGQNLRAGIVLFLLIVNYEIGNYSALPGMARSALRFFVKIGKLSDYDKLLLMFFERKVDGINNEVEKNKIFTEWKIKLLRLQKKSMLYDQTEQFFDFILWLDSKIENRSYADVAKERLK